MVHVGAPPAIGLARLQAPIPQGLAREVGRVPPLLLARQSRLANPRPPTMRPSLQEARSPSLVRVPPSWRARGMARPTLAPKARGRRTEARGLRLVSWPRRARAHGKARHSLHRRGISTVEGTPARVRPRLRLRIARAQLPLSAPPPRSSTIGAAPYGWFRGIRGAVFRTSPTGHPGQQQRPTRNANSGRSPDSGGHGRFQEKARRKLGSASLQRTDLRGQLGELGTWWFESSIPAPKRRVLLGSYSSTMLFRRQRPGGPGCFS